MSSLPNAVLDHVLGLQLGVAWAGEGRCEPRRLAWWDTGLVDPDGGGYLLERLMPRTHAWATHQAALEAARRVDEAARKRQADPDSIRTLFHFGFEVDEQLAQRLRTLKSEGGPPSKALPLMPDTSQPYDAARVRRWLSPGEEVAFKIEAGGRLLKGPPPASVELLANRLAGALVPFTEKYPMPYFRVDA